MTRSALVTTTPLTFSGGAAWLVCSAGAPGAAGKAGGAAESQPAAAGGLGGLTGTVLDTIFGGGADARRGSRRGRESLAEAVAKSAGRAIASTAGRQITNAILRGVLGSLTRR